MHGGRNEGGSDRRELADRIRYEHLHGRGKRRAAGLALGIVAAVVCVGLLAWFQLRSSGALADVAVPEHADEDYGFVLTAELAAERAGDEVPAKSEHEPVQVAVYEDFLCSSCKIFQEQSGDFLASQVQAGGIELSYRPIAFLDRASSDDYSRRAANAAVCVADRAGVAAYAAMHDLLLQNQPAQGGNGLSDERLGELAAEAGADDAAECIEAMTFEGWIDEALEAAADAEVSSTPTVRVDGTTVVRSTDGEESMPGPDELKYAIEAVR